MFYDVHDETKLSTTVQIAGARTAYRMQRKSFSPTKQRHKGEERLLIRNLIHGKKQLSHLSAVQRELTLEICTTFPWTTDEFAERPKGYALT